MRFGYYVYLIRLRSLDYGDQSLFHPLKRKHIRKFFREHPTVDDIMMFDFAVCADKCLCRPWRFPVTGSDEIVM